MMGKSSHPISAQHMHLSNTPVLVLQPWSQSSGAAEGLWRYQAWDPGVLGKPRSMLECKCRHTDGQTDRPLTPGALCHHGVHLREVLAQRERPHTAPHPPSPSSPLTAVLCESCSLQCPRRLPKTTPLSSCSLRLSCSCALRQSHSTFAANMCSEQERSCEYLLRCCSSPGVMETPLLTFSVDFLPCFARSLVKPIP